MNKTFDGAAYCRMILSAAAAIEQNKKKVNELNVFPVPDGDTGTNMSMTLGAAAADLRRAESPGLSRAADITASALLRGARGNSGVILSLLFRGFSRAFKGLDEADGSAFATALTGGVEAAYKAVMKPAEGTILTVSRLAADRARELCVQDSGIVSVLTGTLECARSALENTVNQNETLKKAGVVDAGGMGFVLILDGMLQSLLGNDYVADSLTEADRQADFSAFSSEDITYAYDTVFTVRKNGETGLEPLQSYLSSIGDSLVIGEDDDSFKVHVHTNAPWDAIRESQKYGVLELAKVENMKMQHDDLAAGRKQRSTDDLVEQAPAAAEEKYSVVAVCAGCGLADVFRELGAGQIIEGGQTMNPSTDDILQAIEKSVSDTVFVLPNNKNIVMAAQQAAELSEKQVLVVNSKTVPQGITALLNYDADVDAQENLSVMNDAAAHVSTLQITYAARSSDFDGFAIREGDYLGLIDGVLLGTTRSIQDMLIKMAVEIEENGKELVTVFYGCDITLEQAQSALDLFHQYAPSAEVSLVEGGQPIYYYLISAE